MARKRESDRLELEGLIATPMPEKGTDDDGRLYWRVRTTGRANRRVVWSGRATRAEVSVQLATIVRTGIPSPPGAVAAAPVAHPRTLAELCDRWTAHQGKRLESTEIAPATLTGYRLAVGYWKEALGDVRLDRLTRELVDDAARDMRLDGMSPRTAAEACKVLSSILKWGAPRGWCDPIRVWDVDAASVDEEEFSNESRTPTREEADAVVAALPPGHARDLIELLSRTGARVGEVGALRVGSWDRARDELLISGRDRSRKRRGKVKVRRFPVYPELRALLLRLVGDRAADEPLIATLPPGVAAVARNALKTGCKRAGVAYFTPHGLRRMVVYELLDLTDAKHAATLTGHSAVVLLRHYVRPRPDGLRDVVGRALGKRGKVVAFKREEG